VMRACNMTVSAEHFENGSGSYLPSKLNYPGRSNDMHRRSTRSCNFWKPDGVLATLSSIRYRKLDLSDLKDRGGNVACRLRATT